MPGPATENYRRGSLAACVLNSPRKSGAPTDVAQVLQAGVRGHSNQLKIVATQQCNTMAIKDKPFFGMPLLPVLECLSLSASFLIFDGERGFVAMVGLARDPLVAAPPLVSILGNLARLRALCFGRCCCSGAAPAAACETFGKVLTSVMALN